MAGCGTGQLRPARCRGSGLQCATPR